MSNDVSHRLASHSFFENFPGKPDEMIDRIAPFTGPAEFEADDYLLRESESARSFYLVDSGTVSIELTSQTGERMEIQSLAAPCAVGWSWLIPPHQWKFDGRAVGTVETLRIDGEQLRNLCEDVPALGNRFYKQIAQMMGQRLTGTRMNLLAQTHPDSRPNVRYEF